MNDGTFWNLAKKDEKTVDLYIYSQVGERYDKKDKVVTAEDFRSQLAEAGEIDTICIYINSNGGSVKEGIAIYSQLMRRKRFSQRFSKHKKQKFSRCKSFFASALRA